MLPATMKTIFFAVLMAATLGPLRAAEEATTNTPAAGSTNSLAPAEAPKPVELSADERAQYGRLLRAEWEFNAQLKLLGELTDQHFKSADEAARTGTSEKHQWESLLVQELRAKSSTLLAQLNESTKQRLAFEAAHVSSPASGSPVGGLEEIKALNPNELAYVTRLDERLLQVRQEMAAIDDAAKGLYSELQTNATAEAVGRISLLLDENTLRGKAWEREKSELELKKLEFRALRK